MSNKIKITFFILCLVIVFLVSFNQNVNSKTELNKATKDDKTELNKATGDDKKEISETELRKITEDDLNFCEKKSSDSHGISYGQSGYVLKGQEGENKKCHVKLNSFHDGIVEEIADSEIFSTEFDKIYFVINEGNVSVFTINKNTVKNVLNHELDHTLFTKKDLNAWYWKEDVKLKKDGSAIIFASFFHAEPEVSSPDLDSQDVEEYAVIDKGRKGLFLKFHMQNDSN